MVEFIIMFLFLYVLSYAKNKLAVVLLSIRENYRYHKKNTLYKNVADFKETLNDEDAPFISIVTPAYNEELSIIESVKSFLAQRYPNFEVVVAVDGSTDATFSRLVKHFDLEEIPMKPDGDLPHADVLGVFKPRSKKHGRLKVVLKENGGKGDAQNAGILYASGDYVLITDSDSILSPDALLKMVRPILEDPDIVGVGGSIGVVNNCVVQNNRIKQTRIPQTFLGMTQVIEYMRSFLLSRMGFHKLETMLTISGAFGLFSKEYIIKAGGYTSGSLAEDMDLNTKLLKYFHESGDKKKVTFIPDPLCWTEVPGYMESFKSQRERWGRGLIQTLISHVKVFLNPKYKKLGIYSYPHYVLYEWLTPFVEYFGLIFGIYAIVNGHVTQYEFNIVAFIYWMVSFLINITAVVTDTILFNTYTRWQDKLKLYVLCLIEPLWFHWLNSLLYIYGNIRYMFGARGWGVMKREGLR